MTGNQQYTWTRKQVSMAQDDGKLEGNSAQDRQPELEAGFLDWLDALGTGASIDDLAASVVPVVDAAKDPQA